MTLILASPQIATTQVGHGNRIEQQIEQVEQSLHAGIAQQLLVGAVTTSSCVADQQLRGPGQVVVALAWCVAGGESMQLAARSTWAAAQLVHGREQEDIR